MTAAWSRRDAWWGLALNVLVLPGVGTVMCARTAAGFLQTLGSLLAVVLLVTGDPTLAGVGLGFLLGVAAWSIDGSVRAIRAAG